jgi:hypothetical protein
MEVKDGFDTFYQDSYARLVRQLWAVTGSRQDAEDVVQEAFIRAAARWGRVGAYDQPEAWVRQVASGWPATSCAVSGVGSRPCCGCDQFSRTALRWTDRRW